MSAQNLEKFWTDLDDIFQEKYLYAREKSITGNFWRGSRIQIILCMLDHFPDSLPLADTA